MIKATTKQVREHYKALGYEVRISKDGHVRFRHPNFKSSSLDGDRPSWIYGCYVSEYFVFDGKVFLK